LNFKHNIELNMINTLLDIEKKTEEAFFEKKPNQNCNFTEDQIKELSQIFQFFMNPKSKLLNIKDLVVSLKTLGYNESHPIITSIITNLDKKFPISDLDFPTFLNELCENLVIFFKKNIKLFCFREIRRKLEVENRCLI